MEKIKDREWYQNVHYIFTKEELEHFCKEKRLQKVKIKNNTYYIKYACKEEFKSQMKKEGLL